MVFWIELVPSLGRELVECCLAEDVREEVVVEVRMMDGGGVRKDAYAVAAAADDDAVRGCG